MWAGVKVGLGSKWAGVKVGWGQSGPGSKWAGVKVGRGQSGPGVKVGLGSKWVRALWNYVPTFSFETCNQICTSIKIYIVSNVVTERLILNPKV